MRRTTGLISPPNFIAFIAIAISSGTDARAQPNPTTAPTAAENGGGTTYPYQGWTGSRTREFYHIPEGTFLMPMEWARTLVKNSDKASMYEMVKEHGALRDDESREGLPVGMVIDRRSGAEWLGVTCAMCHTGELGAKGRTIRIVGGSSPVDYPALLSDLYGRLDKATADATKFEAFAEATGVPAERRMDFKKEVDAVVDRSKAFIGIIKNPESVPTPHGPYRLDALGLGAINTAIAFPAQAAQMPPAAQPVSPKADAPVSYPSLWFGPWRDSVQYAVAIHSPLARNVTQAFATSFIPGPHKAPHQNIDFPALIRMEEWLRDLTPPQWPEDIFGSIDRDKAARGGQLFRRECLDCHNWKTTLPNAEGISFLRTVETPPEILKTDPVQYDDFKDNNRRMLILQNTSNRLMGAYFEEADLPPADRISATHGKDNLWRVRAGYGATPLDGIWSTAPYLHNGSVPTLYDLLLPADRRPKTFRLGSLKFDDQKVGLISEGAFEYDTTRKGNSNAGHEYGKCLNDQERWDLVEFLKIVRPWRRDQQ